MIDRKSLEDDTTGKSPRVVLSFESKSGTFCYFGRNFAELLPSKCSWELLENGDLVIKTEINIQRVEQEKHDRP